MHGVPNGPFPNNGIVIPECQMNEYRLRFFCRSDSMEENVGDLIGFNGSASNSTDFLDIVNAFRPGELRVQSEMKGCAPIPSSEQGVYTCRIPLKDGNITEINIGIYLYDTGQL